MHLACVLVTIYEGIKRWSVVSNEKAPYGFLIDYK